MNQLGLFEGRKRKAEGIEKVAGKNEKWIGMMQLVARELIWANGQVTSDDLHAWTLRHNAKLPTHPNAWGAIFHDPHFVHIGYTQSKRPEAHARTIKVWKWQA